MPGPRDGDEPPRGGEPGGSGVEPPSELPSELHEAELSRSDLPGSDQGPPLVGRLIHPGAALPSEPLVEGRLVKPPKTPAGPLFSRGVAAASRSPFLILGLGGAILLSRVGWVGAVALFLHGASNGFTATVLLASGLVGTAALASSLLELTIWSGGIPTLVAKMRGEGSAPLPVFTRGLSDFFASMVFLGFFRIGVWLAFQLLGVGVAAVSLLLLFKDPAVLAFLFPVWIFWAAADILWKILVGVSLARIGTFGEKVLPSISQALRQFARRPMPHLLAWLSSVFATSLVGGGLALLIVVPAGKEGMAPFVASLLVLILSALALGLISLSLMGVYASLSLDDTQRQDD